MTKIKNKANSCIWDKIKRIDAYGSSSWSEQLLSRIITCLWHNNMKQPILVAIVDSSQEEVVVFWLQIVTGSIYLEYFTLEQPTSSTKRVVISMICKFHKYVYYLIGRTFNLPKAKSCTSVSEPNETPFISATMLINLDKYASQKNARSIYTALNKHILSKRNL